MSWVRSGLCLILIGAGLVAQGAEPSAQVGAEPKNVGTRGFGVDWPAFLGPTGDSKSPETGYFGDEGIRGIKFMWQTRLGTGYSMPVVSRGRLFQFTRVGGNARLMCLNAETGESLWEFDYPTDYEDLYGYDNGPRCSPVVDGERVYIFGAEGMLHCLRVVDGGVVWKLDTAERFGVIQNFFGVGSTPVVEGDLLIANIGGSPPESRNVPPGQLDRVKGNGSGVVAFDKLTGTVRYQFSDELASYASPTLATINGRRWCFIFARGGLLGFEPARGTLDFHFPWRATLLESVNASNPVVVGDEVLISETYGPGSVLLRVKPGGSDVVWSDEERRREKSLQTHWNTPVVVDGFVYGSSGRHTENAELRCVEWKSGTVRWSQPELSRASLLYVEGHFFCLTEYGELIILRANPAKFDPLGAIPLRGEADPVTNQPSRLLKYPAWAAPILSHGLLYVRGADRLVCLELKRASP